MNAKNAKAVFLKYVVKTWLWALLLFLGVMVLYSATMPRTNTGYGDSDLFLVLSQKIGLPLPPGYPLYLWLLKIFTWLPLPLNLPVKGHFLSIIFSALSVSLIFLSLSQVVKKTSSLILNLVPALALALSLALNLYFWLYGQMVEKYALMGLLSALIIYLSILILNQKTKAKPSQAFFLLSIVLGLSFSYSYLLWLFIPGLVYLFYRKKPHFKPVYYVILLLTFILAFTLPLFSLVWINHQKNPLSYQVSNSYQGWASYLSRSEVFSNQYLSSTSPILFKPLNLNNASTAIAAYIETAVKSFSIFIALLLVFSLIVGYRHPKPAFWLFLINFLSVGLFAAIYLGWSDDWLSQAEIIPQLIPGLIALVCLCLFGMHEFIRRLLMSLSALVNHRLSQILTLLILFSLMAFNLFSKFKFNDLLLFNDVPKRYQALLQAVPQDSLLFCFTKISCSSLFYQQAINNLRPDVQILPLSFQLINHQLDGAALNTFNYPDNPMKLVDLITTNLNKRPVIVTEINDYYYNLLGFNVPYMYYIPHGTWGEVTRKVPPTLPEYNPDFPSQSLKAFNSPLDPMRLQVKTQPARDHILNAGVFIKMDQRRRALAEMNQAANIFYGLGAPEKKQIDRYRQDIEQAATDPDYALGATVFSARQFLSYIPSLLGANQLSKAYQAAFGAILVEPSNPQARLSFAEVLEKLNKIPESLVEYQNTLLLDPQNASAAASIRRLGS